MNVGTIILGAWLLGAQGSAVDGGESLARRPDGERLAPRASGPRYAGPDLSNLAQKLKRSVVGMEMDLGKAETQGSGFIIRSNGWIVTNHHVIDGAGTITVINHLGERIPVVGILAQSEEHDLAIVKVDAVDLPALMLGDSSEALQGSRVVLLGHPVGLGFSLSEGIVSALRQDGVPGAESDRRSWKQPLIQTTAPISPGSSGSPAVNLGREVIGIAMGLHTRGQNLGFLVPVERLKELMEEAQTNVAANGEFGKPVTSGNLANPRLSNLLTSAVFFALMLAGWWWLRRSAKNRKPHRGRKDWVN